MYGDKFKKATESLMSYCQEQLQYGEQPDVHYVTDSNNANNLLGNTAYYQPDNKTITVFISNRHPKDALRSLAHELVHHAQNVRGDLANSQTPEGYAQKDPHMRKMEEEAYLKGNMMFRDWEDACKSSKTLRLNLPTTLGEQKMTNLKDLIKERIIGILSEEAKPDFPDVDGDGDRKEPISKAQKDKKEKEGGKKKKSKDMSKVPPQLRKHVAKKVEEGGPFPISKSSTRQHAKDLAKNYGDSETAALILRGANREDLMSTLQQLLATGDITPGQLEAAASKMKDVSAKYGSMEESDLEEKSLGGSPGKSVDKFFKHGVVPTVKAITKGAARTAGAGIGAGIGAVKGAKDGYDFVKDKLGLEETEELEEGGAAQRQGNEDRLRRQEPDRIKEEETLEEGKCPHCDGDAPKSECKCGSMSEGSMKKTDRFKEGDKVKHKEDDLGVGTVVSRSGNTVGVRWPSGMRSSDHNMLRKVTKESKESELVDIKKSQNSINSLNETRLLNVNKELMRRLLK